MGQYKVYGRFYVDFERTVNAKNEQEAKKKASDAVVGRKVKKSEFAYHEVGCFEI